MILPWGSLLQAVVAPQIHALRQIACLCVTRAALEFVFSYDEQDARHDALHGLFGSDEYAPERLPNLYKEAVLQVASVERISHRELASYQTTWAKRLAFGRPRRIWRLRAIKMALSAGRPEITVGN